MNPEGKQNIFYAIPISSPFFYSILQFYNFRVVGVVGIGHLAGIQANWDHLSYKDIPAVLQIPPQSKTSKIIKFTFKASLFCFAVYGVHQVAKRSFNYFSKS